MASNNKNIAKNAFFLYVRMFITMGISLFTSRVILQTLGETDFGIYNIVGGIVVLFSFLNAALTTSTQRFLSYALGKNDNNYFTHFFSISITCYLILSVILIILTETLGLWFLNNFLNIPEERMEAARVVYQFSIFSFIVQILRIPYHAAIIAYEKMNFFAYISILETVLKLAIVYLLLFITFDKLILYSFLMFIVLAIITITCKLYSNKKFNTTYIFYWNKKDFKEFLSFSSWSLLGGIANIGSQQALNFMLNIFFSVTVNAAVGIANQVTGVIYNFVTNFQLAFNPQIIKCYARHEIEQYQRLVLMASKISFFLLFIIGLPIIANIDYILHIWLSNVPKFTADFISIIFIYQIIDAISAPFTICVQAKGNIKYYQIIVSILILTNIPLAYIVLKMGGTPYMVWFTKIFVNIICFIFRCYYANKNTNIKIRRFIKEVILRAIIIILICTPLVFKIKETFCDELISLGVSTISSLLITSVFIYFIGLETSEKAFLKNKIKLIYKKHI